MATEEDTLSTKITGLTGLNVMALRETQTDLIEHGALELTATTATFNMPAEAAWAKIVETIGNFDGRGHPKASLHAVARKLKAAV
jgi:hypothetical protein